MLTYEKIFAQTKRAFANSPSETSKPVTDDVPVDTSAILAMTEKLLAVNRGQADPDERDSLEFRRVHTPDKLFAERVKLDASKIRRIGMIRVSKARKLKPIGINHFDPYMEGLIVSSSLSSPGEEINPLANVEQARRITQMGIGGIPSEESVTETAQNIHPSIFGFLSAIEGPESSKIGVDTRLATGAQVGSDGRVYQKLLNRRTNKHQWVTSEDIANKVVGIPA